MANYMADVAKMFGVELGEEFEIQYPSPCSVKTTAMFSEDGFKVTYTDAVTLQPYWQEIELHGLLKGLLIIKRKSWKPKYNQYYWSVTATEGVLTNNKWTDCWMDITYYKLGNCYRTKQEAEANRDKWISFYASDEVLEV